MNIPEQDISPDQILYLQDDDFNLDNVIVVTGAAGGFGRAAAIVAAANNLMTIGLDMDEAEGSRTQELAREMGGQMIFIRTDLTDDQSCRQAIEEAAKLGSVKYLLNTIHWVHQGPVEELPMESFDGIFRLNLRSPYFLSQLVIPHMEKSLDGAGVIGNIASIGVGPDGLINPAGNILKMGLTGVSQCISREGAGKLRAFTICLGIVPPGMDSDGKADPRHDDADPKRFWQAVESTDDISRIRAIEMGNLSIIGLSRFGKYFSEGCITSNMVFT